MSENQRLSRIEDKLDKLSEAVVSLARMEERMVTLFNRMNKYEDQQDELANKIEDVSERVTVNGQTLRFAERLFWIAISAGISTIFWVFQ